MMPHHLLACRGPDPPQVPTRGKHCRGGSRPGMPRRGEEEGSATVEFVICAAGTLLMLLMVVQVGVWYHTRAVAQTAARHGLDHVRTFDGSVDRGVAVATEFLAQSAGGLQNPQVRATRTAADSTVAVSGRVVAVLPGVSWTLSVTVNAPTERIEP